MKLRSPSGRLVNNRHIASKLQLRHERLYYSSDFVGIFNPADLYWMNSSLVHIKKMQKFAVDNKYSAVDVIADLTKNIDKLQVSEFFIENTRSFIFCTTGVRLQTNELTGSWFRQVPLKSIVHKLIRSLVYVSSIKSLDGMQVSTAYEELNLLRCWVVRINLGQLTDAIITDKSLLGCLTLIFERLNNFSNGFNSFLIASSGRVVEISDSELQDNLNYDFVLHIDQAECIETLKFCLLVNGQDFDFEIGLLNNMLLKLPYTEIFPVVLMFVQSKLAKFEIVLNYDQIRLVSLVVLNFVLVKYVAKNFKLKN